VKKIRTVPFLVLLASALPAAESAFELQPAMLKSLHCRVQVPVEWSVYDRSNQGGCSWVITPDDLNKTHHTTGVSIESFAQVSAQTGIKASQWVSARVNDKSASLPVLGSETGPTNDYFQVKRLVTEEVYSPGRTEYTTYRKIYSWYWNDEHDVVICMVARTPVKSWPSMSTLLEGIGNLDVDVVAWKSKLAITEE